MREKQALADAGRVQRRTYVDNAATSFPKPPGVASAVAEFLTANGAPGRGLYAEARAAGAIVRRCRERVCEFLHAPRSSCNHVVFGYNTTDALNLAIKGSLSAAIGERSARANPGPHAGRADCVHVVTTAAEHNSVLRPLQRLADERQIEWTRVPVDARTGLVSVDELIRAVRPGATALVAVNHASNVSGCVQPIEEIGTRLREVDGGRILFLVDAAQSLGHWPVDVEQSAIDLCAFPGHKGLLGPQGVGGLWIRPGVEARVDTIREGGSGNASELATHPRMLPEKYEAGSQNVAGIAGLLAGLEWLLERGERAIRAHELELIERFMLAFDPVTGSGERGGMPGLRLVGLSPPRQRVGVFSLLHESLSPVELSMLLESQFGILTRPGLHCAPLMHQALGTMGGFDIHDEGPGESHPAHAGRAWGACRISLGPFVTLEDVEHVLGSLRAICSEQPCSSPPTVVRAR